MHLDSVVETLKEEVESLRGRDGLLQSLVTQLAAENQELKEKSQEAEKVRNKNKPWGRGHTAPIAGQPSYTGPHIDTVTYY